MNIFWVFFTKRPLTVSLSVRQFRHPVRYEESYLAKRQWLFSICVYEISSISHTLRKEVAANTNL